MIQSIDFRLCDSMPASILEKWKTQLELAAANGRQDAGTPGKNSAELHRRIEKYLDAGHGECWLRRNAVAQLTENALLHFDGQRYRLLAWCVMPNHVHAMIETHEGFPLPAVLHSWKSFIANQANKLLGRHGEFWQREYSDRYIRNAEHYQQAVAYIEENPVKAGLVRLKTNWPRSSARFRSANTGSAGILPAA